MSGAAVPPQSRIGQLLQGEYLIKGILGQGELGVTYEAENARLKSKFAVLMLGRELKPTFEMLLAMRNDLRHAEQFAQAGLMPAKQVVDAQQIPGIATELLEGETLRARLQRGPMQAGRAVALCLAIARALDAAHKAGMVHGDLRPENIFLVKPGAKSRYAGKAVVVEHSLHHLRRRPPGFDDTLPIYKLVYRPPEQIMGESGVSTQGDVFVLGAILYECLTGRPAFFAEEREFVYEKLASPPPALRVNAAIGLGETLAQALSVIIANACQRDPGERIADMSEVIEQLEHVVKATGLVLPDVVTEVPQAAPQAAAGAGVPQGRMNRVLQRLSGIFPQIALPPSPPSDPNLPALKPGAGQGAAASSRPGVDPQKPVAVPARAEVPATLQPITAPKKRVSQVLQRLSGAFTAIQPPPADEDAPPRSEPAKAPAASPPVSAAPVAGAPVSSSGPSVIQTAAQTPGSDAMRALALIQQLARPGGTGPMAPVSPVTPVPPVLTPPNPLPPKSSTEGLEELMRPTLPPSESELLALRMAPVAGVKSGPVVAPAAERSGPAAPVSPAAERSGPAAPVVVPAAVGTSGPAAAPVAAAAALPADLDDLPTAIKAAAVAAPAAVVAPAAAAASGPANAPVPVSDAALAAKSGRAPAPDLAAVPTAIKTAPSEPKPAEPATPSRPGAELAAVPTEVKAAPKEPAVSEPVPASASVSASVSASGPASAAVSGPASRRDAPSDFAAAPTAIKTAPTEPEPAALPPEFLAAPTSVRAAPAREISLSSAETPPRGTVAPAPVAPAAPALSQAATQPRRPRLALDTTLPPDDDAVELIEPELPKPAEPVPAPPAPPVSAPPAPEPRAETAATGGDAPAVALADAGAAPSPATRPASELKAELAELAPIEASPITEQATRPALRRLPITEAATQAKLDVSSLVAALAAQSDPVGPAATPAPSSPPVSPVSSIPSAPPAVPEPAETPPAGSVAPPQLATPAPSGAKPPASPPQRAKRVSQLLEVLKQTPPPTPPSSPGGVPEAQSPLGTGGVARLPARLSPGLVPHAPTALPGQAAPWETSSQPVVAPPPSVLAPQPSFRTFLLQHQEAVAALIGALLVLLISLAFVFWR